MPIKYVVVHRNDQNNVGDIYANPLQYFMPSDQYQIVDITNCRVDQFPDDVPIVVGGGGLLGNEFFGEVIESLLMAPDIAKAMQQWTDVWNIVSNTNGPVRDRFMEKLQPLVHNYLNELDGSKTPRILWGAGHNEDTARKIKAIAYPGWMNYFDLVGIRDYKQPYKWVPCASCMHPALAKKYPIKNKVIWFEHKKQLIKSTNFGNDSIPRFINSGANMEQTIELLGSSEVIITNSYHGAYWGALLGRKVIITEPWSTKFWTLKHKPYTLGKFEQWHDVLDDVNTYPHSLEECIQVTKNYWAEVQQL
jgi:hypothetical protein